MGAPEFVVGGNGNKIAMYEWGNPAGKEILFIHGFSQSHLSWEHQYTAPELQQFRIVAMDIRGHGASDKPFDPAAYADGSFWADDVNAVIQAKGLKKPVLAGWSYGGFIMCNYVRKYGDGGLGGINFVGAATQFQTEAGNQQIGPGFGNNGPRMLSNDLETNIAGTVDFLKACFQKPLSPADFQKALAYNMMVQPEVRLALAIPVQNHDDALAKIKVPVLISHGVEDTVVMLTSAEHIAAHVPHAKKSYYQDVAHTPFVEDVARYNRELVEFMAQV